MNYRTTRIYLRAIEFIDFVAEVLRNLPPGIRVPRRSAPAFVSVNPDELSRGLRQGDESGSQAILSGVGRISAGVRSDDRSVGALWRDQEAGAHQRPRLLRPPSSDAPTVRVVRTLFLESRSLDHRSLDHRSLDTRSLDTRKSVRGRRRGALLLSASVALVLHDGREHPAEVAGGHLRVAVAADPRRAELVE